MNTFKTQARPSPFGLAAGLPVWIILFSLSTPALSQYVPTDPEALRRHMEARARQSQEAQNDADESESRTVDPALQRKLDHQQRVLSRADKALSKARDQVFSGDHRTAARTYMTVRAKLRQPRVPFIEGMLGRIALLEGEPKQAWRFVESWSTRPNAYDVQLFENHLVAGETLIEMGRPRDALILLDWLTGTETQCANNAYSGSVDVVRAAEATVAP